MKTVWILALDGVMDSSLAITIDLLRVAQTLAADGAARSRFEYRVISRRSSVQAGGGMRLAADDTFRKANAADAMPQWAIVPAMGEYGDKLTLHLTRPDAVQARQLLQTLHARKVRIGAACASVFLLAEAGLLAGRTATTTWWLASSFRERYPDTTLDGRRMLVRDGHLLTAGAAFAQLDLMLAVVGDIAGVRVAEACARYLLIDRRPSQARYMMATHALHHDPLVASAERWIDEHLAGPLSVNALAKQLALGEKTLSRRVQAATGFSPIKLIQRRRLLMATHLIETTKLPIEEVAARVGYRDSTTLRRLIRRELEVSPSGLR